MHSDVKCVGLDFGDRIVPPPNTLQLIEAAAIANFVAEKFNATDANSNRSRSSPADRARMGGS